MDTAQIIDSDAVKTVLFNDERKGVVVDFSSDFDVELLAQLQHLCLFGMQAVAAMAAVGTRLFGMVRLVGLAVGQISLVIADLMRLGEEFVRR